VVATKPGATGASFPRAIQFSTFSTADGYHHLIVSTLRDVEGLNAGSSLFRHSREQGFISICSRTLCAACFRHRANLIRDTVDQNGPKGGQAFASATERLNEYHRVAVQPLPIIRDRRRRTVCLCGQGDVCWAMTSPQALRNLPRFKATRHLIESQSKCEVCQDTFATDEEVLALPCIHQLYLSQEPPS